MLKEKEELGRAIAEALAANGYSNADAARKFGVKPPSITGWIQTGRITKANFEKLRIWCSKTPSSHWGLEDTGAPSNKLLSALEDKVLQEFRKVQTLEMQHHIIGYISGLAAVQQKNMRDTSLTSSTKKAANGKG